MVYCPSPKSNLKLSYDPATVIINCATVPFIGLVSIVLNVNVTSGHVKSSNIIVSSLKFLIL